MTPPLPMNVFEPFEAKFRRLYRDRWEVALMPGWGLRVSCPHGWSVQPADSRPFKALVSHIAMCKEEQP